MDSSAQSFGSNKTPPLSSLLPCLIGFGLMIVFVKFPHLTMFWGTTGRYLFFAIASLQLLWGIKQLIVYYFAPQSERIRQLDRNRVMLPREGFMYLGMMIVFMLGALLGKENMLMLVFSLMAGPFILNGWVTYTILQRIDVERQLPQRAMVGEIVPVGISITNRKHWFSSWLLTVQDQISNQMEHLVSGVVFARIPPRNSRSATYQIRPMQRGVFAFGPIEASSRFPFSLVERGRLHINSGKLMVYPRMGKLTGRWKQQVPYAAELMDPNEQQRGAFDDEFHRIREYRHGDNPRDIHWRTSARQSELMVREYQQSRDQELAILLDLWKPHRQTDSDLEAVELGISFAATAAMDHIRTNRGSKFILAASGKTEDWWTSNDGNRLETLLDTFALMQAEENAPPTQLLKRLISQCTARTRIVLVTTRRNQQPASEKGGSPAARNLSVDQLRELLAGVPGASQVQVVSALPEVLSSFFYLD